MTSYGGRLSCLQHRIQKLFKSTAKPDAAEVEQAVRAGARLLVRPKAMTGAVIIAGLLPILIGSGTGSEVVSPDNGPIREVSWPAMTMAFKPAP
jgi:copper/silver efflux system protein